MTPDVLYRLAQGADADPAPRARPWPWCLMGSAGVTALSVFMYWLCGGVFG